MQDGKFQGKVLIQIIFPQRNSGYLDYQFRIFVCCILNYIFFIWMRESEKWNVFIDYRSNSQQLSFSGFLFVRQFVNIEKDQISRQLSCKLLRMSKPLEALVFVKYAYMVFMQLMIFAYFR